MLSGPCLRRGIDQSIGFTLIEILIALFIFTIVALIMTKSLHTILSAQSGTEKNAQQLSETQMALIFISRDLEQAIDRPIVNQQGEVEGSFIANRTVIHFTHAGFANPEGFLQSSSLQRSAYRFEQGQLIRDTWDNLDQSSHTRPHSRVLLKGLSEVSFRYLDNKNVYHSFWPIDESARENANSPAKQNAQQTSLGSKDKLPRAVEINIVFKQGSRLQQTYLLPQERVPHE